MKQTEIHRIELIPLEIETMIRAHRQIPTDAVVRFEAEIQHGLEERHGQAVTRGRDRPVFKGAVIEWSSETEFNPPDLTPSPKDGRPTNDG